MADNKRKIGKPDDIRVNVHQYWERRYWAKKLGCSQTALFMACKEAGPMLYQIINFLKDYSQNKNCNCS